MDDLEEQCDDAVFEVCDARERFPIQCADEFAKCIRLTSEIHVETINPKATEPLKTPSITQNQKALFENFNTNLNSQPVTSQILNSRLEKMLNTVNNLKMVLEQAESDQLCEINKLMKS